MLFISTVNMADKLINVVLLACGSFNPITNLHLRMFEIAKNALQKTGQYKVIRGIISPVSDGYGTMSYGKKNMAPSQKRCDMIRRALRDVDWIRLDSWECEQSSYVETVKVLRHHKESQFPICNGKIINNQEIPEKKRRIEKMDYSSSQDKCAIEGPVQLMLLCGADLLESMTRPDDWGESDVEEIINEFGIVCKTREGYDVDKSIYQSDILYKHQENIHVVYERIVNDISATKIRAALRRGDSVKYLVHDAVIEYILEHKLYGSGGN